MRSFVRSSLCALAVAALAGASFTAPALAQPPATVLVNGRVVTFDQPPVERAGRIFVPLRGVFERLGASVVYDNGTINATGRGGRAISLHLGSTQALIDGRSQYLDAPPFMVGARTLVPLRFIAQALGATVAWDQDTNTVRINGGGSAAMAPAAPMSGAVQLLAVRPTGTVATAHPALHARFSVPVSRSSVRIDLDGADVSSAAEISANGFDFTSPARLAPGRHRVRVRGTTRDGAPFSIGWTFTTLP